MRRSRNGRRLGPVTGSVYLVHFKRRYHGAQHYMGFSTDVPERVKAHRAGRGSPLLRAVTARGISWRVVRIWRRKNGEFEKSLKRRYRLRAVCPACCGPSAHKRA